MQRHTFNKTGQVILDVLHCTHTIRDKIKIEKTTCKIDDSPLNAILWENFQ